MVIEVRKCDGVIVIRARKDQKNRIYLICAHESSSEQGSPLLRCHKRDRRVKSRNQYSTPNGVNQCVLLLLRYMVADGQELKKSKALISSEWH